ncbi:SulP family inorganic anion transporter [Leptospira sp. GIMC2001]|uniref:SulP family inorganic anion transporter n=1 Tax=Leptospira sp. GIMC2001 TaxID=1513297 RepID=UPI00234980AA|nr:SulP family inorganic anion transporter [Leptospira sp. GIMC2001]WCL50357.1 SulP family inorganic anion transporter [Leptospira sp. GIMC2001]
MNFKYFKADVSASFVVFLVALPICLGVALASGAPLYSGILSGIIAGIAIGIMSGSNLSVSGPAAGLAVIVSRAIDSLGSYENFLLAVVVAGIFQIGLGLLKAGYLSSLFPHAIIRGMLAAIGIILILKQVPHAIGYDFDFEGDESFFQFDGHNTFSELFYSFQSISPIAVCISISSLIFLILVDNRYIRKFEWIRLLPGALIVVLAGIGFNQFLLVYNPNLALAQNHLVTLPDILKSDTFFENLTFPNYSAYKNLSIYGVGLTIAIIASIESLLSIEAIDKMDPKRRSTSTNRELIAQGIGNFLCGIFGGIPVTSVIVRSTANLTAGAKTKLSCILHGILLLLSILFFANVLNLIPLSSLAAILIVIGFKLTNPSVFIEIYKKGQNQFIPFLFTIIAILFTDLLIGIFIGTAIGLIFVLKGNYKEVITLTKHNENYLLRLNRDAFFINKPELKQKILDIPDGASVLLDGSRAEFIDNDVLETLEDFLDSCIDRNIDVEVYKIHNARYEIFRKN